MKKVLFVFAITATMLMIGTPNNPFARAKVKLTENLHVVTYSVSDCL